MALHSDDIYVPTVEPVVDAHQRDANATNRSRIDAETPEADPLRERAAAEDRVPTGFVIPLYIAEKFSVNKRSDGSFSLTPFPHFLRDMTDDIERIAACSNSRFGPKSEEAEWLKRLTEIEAERQELYTSFKDVPDSEKYSPLGRAARASLDLAYTFAWQSAVTTFEALEWTARDAAKGNNPMDLHLRNERFAAKGPRADKYESLAAAAYQSLPKHLRQTPKVFAQAAIQANIWTMASIYSKELRKLASETVQTPAPASPEAKANARLAYEATRASRKHAA
jgi:hypothetical protein